MRVHTAIRLPFLFHTSTISSKSLSMSFSGDSMTILIKLDRISSVTRLPRWFFNFMSEKLCSADAVEMGIVKHMVASLRRLGNKAISMSLVSNSFSCMDISSFGCLIRSWRYIFHSVLWSEETMAAFSNSVPSNDLVGESLPNCPVRVWIELSPYIGSSWVERLGTFFGSKILKADNTSFEEDLNQQDMLSLMCLMKGFLTSWKEHIYKWVTSIPVAAFNSSLASCSCKTQFAEGSIANQVN